MEQTIKNDVSALRTYFNIGASKSLDFRIKQLRKFRETIIKHQAEIETALWNDLRKSSQEAYLTEISIVLQEIDLHIKKLRSWAKPQKVRTQISIYPSRSYIYTEPLGVTLIMAPWNYPFQLILNPLVGAISAGCVAMLKPSPAAKETAKIVEKIIRECFDTNYVNVVQGGREVNALLLKEKYDFIFFTGSPFLGKLVYKAAAENLTPVILELGGKSPCVVDKDADIQIAARRIMWGKSINSGQTCIAPDYLFVHLSVKEKLLDAMKQELTKLYSDTENIEDSAFYPRMINEAAFDRVKALFESENICFGGKTNCEKLFIEPTVVDGITPESKIMQEEIFGPVLPLMTFESIGEVYDYVNKNDKPLALYYFGKNDEDVLKNTTSGGACINDTLMHIANQNLPFGGVGNSGMAKYHGRESFLLFSNRRSVVKSINCIDLPFKYPPFKYFNLVKKIL